MDINLKNLTIQEMLDLQVKIDQELDRRKEVSVKIQAILDNFDFYTAKIACENNGWSWVVGETTKTPTVQEMRAHCKHLLEIAYDDPENPTWWESGRFLVTKDDTELSLFFAPIVNRAH